MNDQTQEETRRPQEEQRHHQADQNRLVGLQRQGAAQVVNEAKSYREEGLMDVQEGDRYRLLYERLGLSYYLRKASKAYKMAADEIDRSEYLEGNTLISYMDKEEE